MAYLYANKGETNGLSVNLLATNVHVRTSRWQQRRQTIGTVRGTDVAQELPVIYTDSLPPTCCNMDLLFKP